MARIQCTQMSFTANVGVISPGFNRCESPLPPKWVQWEGKELNMRQRRWLELLSDYDYEIRYHTGKTNILNAQAEAMQEENVLEENLYGMNKEFETRAANEHSVLRNRVGFNGEINKAVLEGSSLEAWSANMSMTYHPQTDGQSERAIQTLEDMLCSRVIDFGKGWDRYLPLVEFLYNNGYHMSIKATLFEALYGRKLDDGWKWQKSLAFGGCGLARSGA
ncbi:putative reverse transcriptase domain-containing protein [Tanacetum coccineum]|uniref:Reverse transcriptase domain-containing protein n=1 Tax=Tanacetum coccineum TaxID=301880 RepID=A0ABQ5I937_9ASTR